MEEANLKDHRIFQLILLTSLHMVNILIVFFQFGIVSVTTLIFKIVSGLEADSSSYEFLPYWLYGFDGYITLLLIYAPTSVILKFLKWKSSKIPLLAACLFWARLMLPDGKGERDSSFFPHLGFSLGSILLLSAINFGVFAFISFWSKYSRKHALRIAIVVFAVIVSPALSFGLGQWLWVPFARPFGVLE
jgi:hypothetical protein